MNAKTKKLFDSIINCKMSKQVTVCQQTCNAKQKTAGEYSCCCITKLQLKGKKKNCKLSKICDCWPIVNYQFILDCIPVWQCPEPWVGDLESAPVLFLSSNPGINRDEVYPALDKTFSSWNTAIYTGMDWSNSNDIEDFFVNRFSATVSPTVNSTLAGKYYVDDLKALQTSGKYSKKEPYWRIISKYLYAISVNLGMDTGICDNTQKLLSRYSVLSEIVHCKSNSEFGVKYAVNNCIPNYLNDLLDIFINDNDNCKMIVVVGKKAENYLINWVKSMKSSYGLVNTGTKVGSYTNSKGVTDIDLFDFNFNGKIIKMIFVPHPNYFSYLKNFMLYDEKIV